MPTNEVTKSDITGLDVKVDKLTWMMGIQVALAIANFARQFCAHGSRAKPLLVRPRYMPVCVGAGVKLVLM